MSKKNKKLYLELEYNYDICDKHVYDKANDMFNKIIFFINYWGLDVPIDPVIYSPSENQQGDYWLLRFVLSFEKQPEEEYIEKLIKYAEPNKSKKYRYL